MTDDIKKCGEKEQTLVLKFTSKEYGSGVEYAVSINNYSQVECIGLVAKALNSMCSNQMMESGDNQKCT